MSLETNANDLNDLLMNLEAIDGIVGLCLVKNNGIVVTTRLPSDIDNRKFGALASTMFASMEMAASSFNNNNINSLTVEFTQNYQVIVLRATNQMLIVSLIDLNANLGLILIEIEETIKNIKELTKG